MYSWVNISRGAVRFAARFDGPLPADPEPEEAEDNLRTVSETLSSDSGEEEDVVSGPPAGALVRDLSGPVTQLRPVLVTLTPAEEVRKREAATPTMSKASRVHLPDSVYELRTRYQGLTDQIRTL